MAKELDVYRDWLGVTETARPLDCYQLLRLKPFTDDTAKIRAHYQKMNAHVRKYATGDYSAQSQDLLNELARAMLCLTDATRKREYDATLGRKTTDEGRQRSIEEILLANQAVTQQQVDKARSYADAVGLEIRDAFIQQKMAPADVVMLAYAESMGLPFVDLADVGVDETLAAQVPPTLARQHSCIPVMVDEGQLLMASPNPLVPDVEEELRLRFSMPVRTVLCTAAGINALVSKHYPRDAAGPAAAPVPAKKSAAKEPEAPKKPAAEPDARPGVDGEMLKRHGMFAVVGFNFTVMLCVIVLVILRGSLSGLGAVDYVIALGLALVVGGSTFAVARKLNL